MKKGIPARFLIVAALLALTTVAARSLARRSPAVSTRQPLAAMPAVLGAWRGNDLTLLPNLAAAAGVDDYLYRRYTDPAGSEIETYVGYYRSQSSGKLIHSPKHCLPGTGWQPVRTAIVSFAAPEGRVDINEYLVVRDMRQLLVLYWYQGRGRAIASEYSLKLWNIADAIRYNRTDGALVRLSESTASGETQARADLLGFARLLYPRLEQMLPR